MDEKIRKEIEELVKNIFSEKEEADVRKRTSDALEISAQTIEDLTEALEAKNEEFSAAEVTLSDLNTKIQELEAQLEAAKQEVSEKVEGLEKANKEIEDMKKDKAMDLRMQELETSGVVRSDKKSQATKVREMSEEEFASYKEELISIREGVMAEIAAKKEAEDKKATDNHTDAANDGDERTPEAKIDPEKQHGASLNFETSSIGDVSDKYKQLGQAMAELFK